MRNLSGSKVIWEQDGNKLSVIYSKGINSVMMPPGWRLEAVHDTALACAEWMLFDRLSGEKVSYDACMEMNARPKGDHMALCFSGGADSMAAHKLLDNGDRTRYIPIYLRRDFLDYKKKNALVTLPPTDSVIDVCDRIGAVQIINDLEKIRLNLAGKLGFRSGWGYGVIIMLLADHYNLGALSLGAIFDTVFTGGSAAVPEVLGHRFVDIIGNQSSSYNRHKRIFNKAGLDFILPVGACSEAITVNITKSDGIISCPSADKYGNSCGKCIKCFRKQQILGERVDVDASLSKLLQKRPLKMATSTLEGCRVVGYYPEELKEFEGMDTEWTNRYYREGLYALNGEYWGALFEKRLQELGISPMSNVDVKKMKSFML